jgi:hypothetical protein
LLLDPGLVLDYRSTDQVGSDGKLVNDAGRASPHKTILLGWEKIGKSFFSKVRRKDATNLKRFLVLRPRLTGPR